jgi:hypothetical protein
LQEGYFQIITSQYLDSFVKRIENGWNSTIQTISPFNVFISLCNKTVMVLRKFLSASALLAGSSAH